jgi:hypothetical protein
MIDLESLYDISEIVVWNRTDCCSERLNDFHVLVSNEPFPTDELVAAKSHPGVNYYRVAGPAAVENRIQVGRTGRYVRVQLTTRNFLSLAEVQVIGTDFRSTNLPPILATVDERLSRETESVALNLIAMDKENDVLKYSATNLPKGLRIDETTGLISGTFARGSAGVYNVTLEVSDPSRTTRQSVRWEVIDGTAVASDLARNAAVSQSSTAYGAVAANATDGIKTSLPYGYSRLLGGDLVLYASNTTSEDTPWWEADLGDVYELDELVIWNRSDCCWEEISDFHVFVSTVPFDTTDLALTLSQPDVYDVYESGDTELEEHVAIGQRGRFVRIQRVGKSVLRLAEVQIVGRTIDRGGPPVSVAAGVATETISVPVVEAISAIYPNPAAGNVSVRYDVPVGARVDVSVYDLTGRLVARLAEGDATAGYKTVSWDVHNTGGPVPASGVYLIVLDSGDRRITRKVVRVDG